MLLDAFMYQPHITDAVCYRYVNIYEAKALHGPALMAQQCCDLCIFKGFKDFVKS